MRFYKNFLPLMMVIVGLTSSLYARDDSNPTPHEEALNERDLQALKDFLRQKRQEAVIAKPDYHLTITGDVRTEWRHLNEKKGHHLVRGGDAVDCKCIPYSRNDFDIEANMLMIYNTDRTWATLHLQYDNAAGIDDIDCRCDTDIINKKGEKEHKEFCRCNRFHGSGDQHNLNLKRAFFGYNIWTCGENTLDIEVGRRRLYDVFDSEIQFLSRFDGILLKYSGVAESFGDYYFKIAGFVVDERVNHFAYAAEVGLLNIRDSGLDIKYSFIDWNKRGRNRCFEENPRATRYRNSQLTLSYHLDPEILCRPVEFFGAVEYNHNGDQVETHNCIVKHESSSNNGSSSSDDCSACKRNPKCPKGDCVPDNKDGSSSSSASSHEGRSHKHRNWAWYAGFLIGEVEKEGDWSFEFQYQWVQENAISFDDENGIGVGDFLSDCCGNEPTPGYKGWLIDVMYGVTDDLSLDMTIESTRKNQPGPHHTYSKFELEAIYAF